MRTLTQETFKRLVQTDAIPFVIVNFCEDPDSKIPYIGEDAKVVTVDEFSDELVPEDGVAVVVRDSDRACPFEKVEFKRSVSCFDMRTPAATEPFEIPMVSCEEVLHHTSDQVVVDIRRSDEQANFGTLPDALCKPLHEIMHDYTHSVDLNKTFKLDTLKKQQIDVFCRCNRRAKLCAQLLHDVGLNVVIADKGAVGLSQLPEAHMKPYRSYEVGDDVPDPSTEDCGCGIQKTSS